MHKQCTCFSFAKNVMWTMDVVDYDYYGLWTGLWTGLSHCN